MMLFAVDKDPSGWPHGGEQPNAVTGHTRRDAYRRGKTVGDLDREGQPGPRKVTAGSHNGASECLNTNKCHSGRGLGFFQSG